MKNHLKTIKNNTLRYIKKFTFFKINKKYENNIMGINSNTLDI